VNYRNVKKYLETLDLSSVPEKVLNALKEMRIILLVSSELRRQAFIFKGKERDYLIIPKLFCTCKDFEFNVVLRKLKPTCYHLIATELALRKNHIKNVEVDSRVFDEVLYEVIYDGFSKTLRKVLVTGRSSNDP